MRSANGGMRPGNCLDLPSGGIVFLLLAILSLSGCGGGGTSSSVTEGPPAAPTGVSVIITASNELTVSWNSVQNASSYNVYWTTAPGANKTSTRLSGIKSPQYVHAGLATGVTYYYVVTAVNSFGESSESVEVFALLDIPRPTGAVSAVAGDGQVTLSWNTNGAVSYNVYMASQPGVTKANFATLADGAAYGSTGGSHTVTGLINGRTYYFVVSSVNSFGESGESSEVAAVPSANATLSVAGSVKYEDREYGTSGFTGTTSFKAVRFADVQAVDSISGTIVASGATDVSGSYSLAIPLASASAEMYVRVISSSLAPAISVKDLSDALYAVAGSAFVASGPVSANISVQAASPAGGAFNILDAYVTGAQFVQSLSGSYPPALAAFWQAGNPNGTYYCKGMDIYCPYGDGVYVLNYIGDTDEYDDDVLWHEYGHFVAAIYSKDDSPGGFHYLSSNDLDLRLSWSEGWGDSFPAAVKNWLNGTSPALLSTTAAMPSSMYVDTWGSSASFFDFLNVGGYPYFYASNEVAVSRVLLVLNASYGFQSIWDTFSSGFLTTSATPVNLEVFWNAWNSLGKADITAILSERQIAYSADIHEASSDDAPSASRKLAIGVNEFHTLYGGNDVDVVAFDAVAGLTYTVRTSTLRNGADTYLRIIAPDQLTVVAGNDNQNGADYSLFPFVPNNCDMYGECHENGFDILGSVTTFTATASGTYFAEVRSSPNRPISAGKYGDYVLTITTP